MSEPTDKKIPRGFEVTSLLYEALKARATIQDVNDVPLLVFEGSAIEVFRSLGASNTFYARSFSALTEMGCITRLARGNRIVKTRIAIHHAPSIGAWRATTRTDRLTHRNDVAMLSEQVESLSEQIGGIDIAGILAGQQIQIDSLRERVKRLEAIPENGTPEETTDSNTGTTSN